jgi:hypothetical protein
MNSDEATELSKQAGNEAARAYEQGYADAVTALAQPAPPAEGEVK